MRLDDVFWVKTVSIAVFAACIIGIVGHSVREKRRTGRWPGEQRDEQGRSAWFFAFLFTYMAFRRELLLPAARHLHLNAVVSGIDIGLLVALLGVTVWAVAHAFRSKWSGGGLALWISWHLLLPVFLALDFSSDLAILRASTWAWLPAVIVALVLTPFFTRFAFTDAVIGSEPRDNLTSTPGMRSFRLWRPGDPE